MVECRQSTQYEQLSFGMQVSPNVLISGIAAVVKDRDYYPGGRLDGLVVRRSSLVREIQGLNPTFPGGRYFTSLHLSLGLVDRWGTKDDRATTVLHSSLFSAFRRASPNFNPVHSVTLSSHRYFCLPLLLPPCTVPYRIIFANPVHLVLCPYQLS